MMITGWMVCTCERGFARGSHLTSVPYASQMDWMGWDGYGRLASIASERSARWHRMMLACIFLFFCLAWWLVFAGAVEREGVMVLEV